MEQISGNVNQPLDAIDEKLNDDVMLEKIVKQAVAEAVDKAQRLGFLPVPPKSDSTQHEPSSNE